MPVPVPKVQPTMGVIKLSDYETRRAVPNAEYYRILADCRDLTTHRLLVSFTSMMDRLVDRLLEKANRSGIMSDTNLLLETRSIVQTHRAYIVSALEKGLRGRIDRRLRGEADLEAEPDVAEYELELVDHVEVEQDIALLNLMRSLADRCHDELVALNARIGFLLGERNMETERNPFGPFALGKAFHDAWDGIDIKPEGKIIVLKMVDDSVVGDVNSVYADLNRHLANLNVLPQLGHSKYSRSASSGGRSGSAGGHGDDDDEGHARGGSPKKGRGSTEDADVDLFAMLRELFGRMQRSGHAGGAGGVGGVAANFFPQWPAGMMMPMGMPMGAMPGVPGQAGEANANPWAGFAIGPAGTPIPVGGVDPQVIASLTRLQQGFGGGAGGMVSATGVVPIAFDATVLRRLTPQELGPNVDATGAMTIELVAMLFDFVSADRQLPDAIKALLGRLQIPVLKAAMLDREFFSKRKHPARLLVNRYAEAGMAWQLEHGTADPLYLKIQEGVARIQSEFTDQVELFAEILQDLESFLSDEERKAEQVVQLSADDILRRERQEVGHIVADAEVGRRVNSAQPPEFLANFLRSQWQSVLIGTYLENGEEGDEWRSVLADMDNLLWSVQPKRNAESRRELVARLPEMLSRMHTRLADVEWDPALRETFMTELVECHARAVTAGVSAPAIAAETPVPLAESIILPEHPLITPLADTQHDRFYELAESMARGMWVEFTEESGVLVFAKLSWVSPLRGKYLFTHRNGLKAFSLSREDLAQRFRDDTASPVEAEPLLDRAFSDVMSRLSAQVGA
ncbi:MAG: DUF1631 domain-containing protein [Betaproteobacteria bacterium]